MNYFIKRNLLVEVKCPECSHLALYDSKYPIDRNDPRLSNLNLNWKRYENVTYTHVVDSSTTTKNITLLDDNISVTSFMEKLRVQI